MDKDRKRKYVVILRQSILFMETHYNKCQDLQMLGHENNRTKTTAWEQKGKNISTETLK